MENECLFVSSRGLLKSCDVHSSSPQSSCDTDTGYLETFCAGEQPKDVSIYVCSQMLHRFVDEFMDRIHVSFVLVSGDADQAVPDEVLSNDQFQRLVTNDKLLRWYAQNLTLIAFPMVFNLPIGLDYHTIGNDPNHWWKMHTESHMPVDQDKMLFDMGEERKKSGVFDGTLGVFSNTHLAPDRWGQRMDAHDKLSGNLGGSYAPVPQHLSRSQTWQKNMEYSFVLSPYGNGFDCHRTWEALCLGAIPIMKAPHFRVLFQDLPVLNVSDWEEINEDLLQNTLRIFRQRQFNYEKLKLSYWTAQISPK